jgi:hypothetical protein
MKNNRLPSQHKQYAYEQFTIGLIICAKLREAGYKEVIYALGGLEEKIFFANYKAKLPNKAKIKKAIRKFDIQIEESAIEKIVLGRNVIFFWTNWQDSNLFDL